METFKTIDNNPQMGLNNKICESPAYYCKSKRIFLSEEDVKNKSCLQKMNTDMIGISRCKMLITAEEFQKQSAKKTPKENKKTDAPVEKPNRYYGEKLIIYFSQDVNTLNHTFQANIKRVLVFHLDYVEISGRTITNQEYEKIKQYIRYVQER